MRGFRKLLAAALAVGTLGIVAGASTWAAFSDTTANPGNSFESGTVSLTDNDGDAALLSLSDALPGATTSGCIKVTYDGNLDAGVRLHGNVSGTLAQYLTLKVTRGTDTGTFPNCNFTADTRDYIGKGAGVVYDGDLSAFPSSYAGGIVDPEDANGGPETWSTSEVHAYKLEVTLQADAAAEGQSADAGFTWEARNQ